jgi:hypothetical protein
MIKVLVALALGLTFRAGASTAQPLNPNGFTERHDTLFVQAAGVIVLTASESALSHAYDAARSSTDSEAVAAAIDDYLWYLSTSRDQLDKLHIPNAAASCRYICLLQEKKQITFDRRKLVGSDSLELYDALVTDGRSEYRFLTEFQLGNPQALADIKRVLRRDD